MGVDCSQKHFIPLESNPEVFTHFIHQLGVSTTLSFRDVLTLDEPNLLSHPALALILIFPTSSIYEAHKSREEALNSEYTRNSEEEVVIWFKQTINNACGLYAILHAVCNGEARGFIRSGTFLATLLETCLPLQPQERAVALENSRELESMYAEAAVQGDSAVPENAEDEVDFHFVCFVKSHKNSRIYELDGDRKGPIDKGITLDTDEDMLADSGVRIVREFIQRENRESSSFSLMALVPT